MTEQKPNMKISDNKGLILSNFDEMMRYTKVVTNSGLCPRGLKGKTENETTANVFVALQWGFELGMTPMASIQNIAVVNGNPTIWGDMQLALVRKSGQLEKFHESYEGTEEAGDLVAICTIKRYGFEEVTERFSIGDAKRAMLWGKTGTWKTHPKRMLRYKARAFALRDNFADILKGLKSKDELEGEIIEAEVVAPKDDKKKEKKKKEDRVKERELLLIADCQTVDDIGRVTEQLEGRHKKEVDKRFNEITATEEKAK